jgi:ribosome recycling factor
MGFNPANDGQVIRIPVPALTEDRRREMVKMVKHKVEESRVAMRNVRRDSLHQLDEMKKEKMIGEDEHKRAGEKLEDIVHKYSREADHVGEAKEAEVLEV